MINDIECDTKLFFAEYTSIYLMIDNEYMATEEVNKDI